jgi:hypothetical protein
MYTVAPEKTDITRRGLGWEDLPVGCWGTLYARRAWRDRHLGDLPRPRRTGGSGQRTCVPAEAPGRYAPGRAPAVSLRGARAQPGQLRRY